MAPSKKTHIKRITAQDHPEKKVSRVVDYLNDVLEDYSRSGIKKMVKRKLIFINQVVANTADYIRAGDVIDLYQDTSPEEVWKIPLNVRYEDNFIAVVHKPAGIPTSGYGIHTLTGALPFNIMLNNDRDGIIPHPVHRLDRDTEGLVIVAKTRKSASVLSEMLSNGQISKTYRTWVHGIVSVGSHWVWDSLVRDKHAITQGKVLSIDPERNLSLLELAPITGRTHQLRIHCAQNNTPIVGDNKYGQDKGMRLKLIAYSLCFNHPMNPEHEINVQVSEKHLKRFNKIILS